MNDFLWDLTWRALETGEGRSRSSVQHPHVLQPFLDVVIPGYAVSEELGFRNRLPDFEFRAPPKPPKNSFRIQSSHRRWEGKGDHKGGHRSCLHFTCVPASCHPDTLRRRGYRSEKAGETEALAGEPDGSRSAELGVQRRPASLGHCAHVSSL